MLLHLYVFVYSNFSNSQFLETPDFMNQFHIPWIMGKVCLGTGHKLEGGGGGGRAGAFLFWPTCFGETLPIPGAEKMLALQNSLHNLS